MKHIRTKSGAASFYIVAFSTLLLGIIVVSFASIIISEVTRTTGSDLSQSAYDSALAGVEDAKAALLSYHKCLSEHPGIKPPAAPSGGKNVTCEDIVYFMNTVNCDMVGHILNRIPQSKSEEVIIDETTSTSSGKNNTLKQAYTCVKITPVTEDYRATLTASNPVKVMHVRVNGDHGNNASKVAKVRLSWYSEANRKAVSDNNGYFKNGKVVFPVIGGSHVTPVPPAISFSLFQTSPEFSLSQLNLPTNKSGQTDHGTVVLVPISNKIDGPIAKTDTYINATAANTIPNNFGLAKSNDGNAENLPFLVHCPVGSSSEFACSVVIDIPQPIGGTRSNDTFLLSVSTLYGQPDTDFRIELLDASNGRIDVQGLQVSVDSTGRANDFYRRVETRLEYSDASFPYPEYALQLLGRDSSDGVKKNFYTTMEHGI